MNDGPATSGVGTAFPVTESLLVDRLRANESGAYEELVRAFGGRMLAIARRLLNNEDDAREAVQESFLAAFKAIGRFQGNSLLSTWLHRIVVNASLLKLRGRRRHEPDQSIDDLLPQFFDDGHQASPAVNWSRSPSESAHRKDVREWVRSGIETLPENYQIILKLRDIEGLDTAETAEVLGIEPNAVKVRLHRARQALRSWIDRRFRGDDL